MTYINIHSITYTVVVLPAQRYSQSVLLPQRFHWMAVLPVQRYVSG